MDLQQNQEIREAIARHLASGKYSSAEEVVLTALSHLDDEEAEYQRCLSDLAESMADEEAGRLTDLTTVANEIRRQHGFSGRE